MSEKTNKQNSPEKHHQYSSPNNQDLITISKLINNKETPNFKFNGKDTYDLIPPLPTYDELISKIKELENEITQLKSESNLKDKKIINLEKEITTLNLNKHLKKTNSSLSYNPPKLRPSNSMNLLTNKHSYLDLESKFNPDNSTSGFGYDANSLISNSFFNEVSISASRFNSKIINRRDMTDSTINLKLLNDLEIDELYDNEMETFLDKLKNVKPLENNLDGLKLNTIKSLVENDNINKDNFTSFKFDNKESETKVTKSGITNGREKSNKINSNFKRTLKENEAKTNSIRNESKSIVKSYINQSKLNSSVIETKIYTKKIPQTSKLNKSMMSFSIKKTKIPISNSIYLEKSIIKNDKNDKKGLNLSTLRTTSTHKLDYSRTSQGEVNKKISIDNKSKPKSPLRLNNSKSAIIRAPLKSKQENLENKKLHPQPFVQISNDVHTSDGYKKNKIFVNKKGIGKNISPLVK